MDLMGLVLQVKVTKNSGRKGFSHLIQSVADRLRAVAKNNSKEALASCLEEVSPSHSWLVSLQHLTVRAVLSGRLGLTWAPGKTLSHTKK